MSKLNKEKFIESLKGMTLLEIKELVDGIKEEFGIDPSSVLSATNQKDSETKNEQEEKTEFQVILKTFGQPSNKIAVIKAVRDITNLGLSDSKNLTETPDSIIKENINKQEAEKIKKQLELLGATVELK
ncbi:50S ribosomal protein L7/L12 [Texas Phoenix palm phytoplasma]|uniref:Large ribosomal subunit protein bL12 n=1 Tax=Texas Phoenix palm phytoplasma TaxID=176709 RepID=A0ABS5BKM3_9MOLU|nr:50S ribosomal protein L7/L12 [Texas Phoenix palm phytoplasma]MBP3059322.1 50S ribosomal protein L7/L12 [Texas Phoenix palm phytoplasma]